MKVLLEQIEFVLKHLLQVMIFIFPSTVREVENIHLLYLSLTEVFKRYIKKILAQINLKHEIQVVQDS